MNGVDREDVRRLWFSLAAGDLQTVEVEPWMPGYQ